MRPQARAGGQLTRWKRALPACLLLGVTVLAYWPALHGSYVWDDDKYVTANWTLRSADGLKAIWLDPAASPQYYPLTLTTFWVEYHLWGLHPLGYHIVNVLLHATSAILFWLLLRRLSVPGAWIAAMLFAVHPVYVESVAWVTELKNVQSGAFYLAAVYAYLEFRRADWYADRSALKDPGSRVPKAGRSEVSWTWYGLATFWFVCAVLSKTVTASAPAAVLVVGWWITGRVRRRDVGLLAPWLLVGVMLGLATAWLEQHHVGAMGVSWKLSPLDRCLLAGRVVWFYLAKLVWPVHLCFVYPRWTIDAGVWWQYLYPVATVGCGGALFLARKRIGRGPFAAYALFVGTLFPALGFFDVYPMQFSFVADHFQYLAGLGVLALAGAAIERLGSKSELSTPSEGGTGYQRRRGGALPIMCAAVLVAAFAVKTWRQSCYYKDAESLWRATLSENRAAWLAQCNLGLILLDQGHTEQAVALVSEARQEGANNAQVRLGYAFAMVRTGRLDAAYAELSDFVKAYPDSAHAHALLGAVDARRSNIEAAMRQYQAALRLKPDLLQARSEYAYLLLQEGFAREAAAQYETLLAMDPNNEEARAGYARALSAAEQAPPGSP